MANESTSRKRALITGITGQDGSYLTELLLAKGYEVWGLVRHSSSLNTTRINHIDLAQLEQEGRLNLCYGDLLDGPSLQRVLSQSQPDEVYNLAAQSHVKVSFEVPEATGNVNALGPARLLGAINELGLTHCRFYQASSSEVYGQAVESPQNETTPFWPRSPYGAAKAYAHYLTRNFRESYGIFAVNGILFNHESPRRDDKFVTRKISRGAARIKLGMQDTLQLGNLDAKRDWGFAGDYVVGMWKMLQLEEPSDFVLATGEAHSVREFCELCFAEVDMPLEWRGAGEEERGYDPQGKLRVEIDRKYFRPAEVDCLVGDATKARQLLEWSPTVSFEELATMMVQSDLALAESDLASEMTPTDIL